MTAAAQIQSPRRMADPAALALRWASVALVVAAWVSAGIFGAYILAYYGGAVPLGAMAQWNQSLPRLYEAQTPAATAGLAAHFLTGGIILLLGPIQLVGGLRARAPALHRWLGRLYVAAGFVAGLGGLLFILLKGTVGGGPMNLGFGLYGALMVLAAVQTYRYGRARRLEAHRAWAIRLFALAIGSWLYRMDYGFWSLIAHDAGHTHSFDGPFDVLMAFFFYVPNLAVAELFIRGRGAGAPAAARIAAAAALAAAAGFVALGTYYFTSYLWGPDILARLSGA